MADAFVKMLGPTLLTHTGPVKTEERLAGKKFVALYFSAHWCPPCRGFTPILGVAYEEMVADGPDPNEVEVVFVSSDSDKAGFDGYFKDMPWVALPFGDAHKESLSTAHGVRGIPTLIVLDATGKVVDANARATVSAHKKLSGVFKA